MVHDQPVLEALRDHYIRWRTRRWVTVARGRSAGPLGGTVLHAVMVTWNEADVASVTVRNALEQGCDAVHLLDNGSDDGTVDVARRAGAEVREVFRTEGYDGAGHERRIRATIEQVSRSVGGQHVWWLLLDADELVEGPNGSTIRELVDSLDASVRVVGSRTVNHYPRAAHPMEVGADPRWFPTNEQERTGVSCGLGHWKHPLVRWDADGPPVSVRLGAHVVDAPQRLRESRMSLVSHHYPFRNPDATRARLDRLSNRLADDRWAMGRRLANADPVYREAYGEVDPHDMVGPGQVFAPVPRPAVRPRPTA